MLIHGRIGMDKVLNDVSLWLDCGFLDVDERAAALTAQDHRRSIKSHTPFDGISYDPACTYFAVCRHPLDVHFLMRQFALSMNVDLLNDRYPEDISSGFRMFLYDRSKDGGNDDMTLDSITWHYQSFQRWAHLPNVHLIHYADLKRDLKGQVKRIATLIGGDYSDRFIEDVAEGSRFDTMKENARQTVSTAPSVLDDPASFFASGTNNK